MELRERVGAELQAARARIDQLENELAEELGNAEDKLLAVEGRLAKKDADATLGRELRELRSKVPASVVMHITPEVDALAYYIMWLKPTRILESTEVYDDPLLAIREYNRRKD